MSLKKLRALIVEDSEPDCVLLLRELGKAGYDVESRCVETAPDMEEALDSAVWDIILCDHVLPVFSGPDAIRLVKRKGIDIPLIIVSGQISEAYFDRMIEGPVQEGESAKPAGGK